MRSLMPQMNDFNINIIQFMIYIDLYRSLGSSSLKRRDSAVAVSYTHLDVYKRQVCVCVCVSRMLT